MVYVLLEDALNAFGLSEKTRKYGGDHSGYDTLMLYEIQNTLESLPTVDADRANKECTKVLCYAENCKHNYEGFCDDSIFFMPTINCPLEPEALPVCIDYEPLEPKEEE